MADSKDTYRTVTPYLVVSDADAELAFLKAAFGATEVDCQRNPDNRVMHAEMKIGDSLVMLGQASGRWTPRPAALYLWVDNVDATYARALQERRPKASPRTSRMDTAMPESSIRTASRGGLVLRSDSARRCYFHENSTSTPRNVE
jgi:glyoxalase/bleomycin resistance protein/dioxygenase superfamily protein